MNCLKMERLDGEYSTRILRRANQIPTPVLEPLNRLNISATRTGLMPTIVIRFCFDDCPPMMLTCEAATPNAFAKVFINYVFAAPSTGAAAIRTRNIPSRSPTISLRLARGTTLTAKLISSFVGRVSIILGAV